MTRRQQWIVITTSVLGVASVALVALSAAEAALGALRATTTLVRAFSGAWSM